MTLALQALAAVWLLASLVCVVALWRRRSRDTERDQRLDRALRRGHSIAPQDRDAAVSVLERNLLVAVTFTLQLLCQLTIHAADQGTSVDGVWLTALVLMVFGWVGAAVLVRRVLLVARRQGLRPRRVW